MFLSESVTTDDFDGERWCITQILGRVVKLCAEHRSYDALSLRYALIFLHSNDLVYADRIDTRHLDGLHCRSATLLEVP